MKDQLLITLTLLLLLTMLSVGLAHVYGSSRSAGLIIMLPAAIKFYLVAFRFMELRKAHRFWKGFTLFFMTLMVLLSLLA